LETNPVPRKSVLGRWVKEFLPNLNLRQKWFKVHSNVAKDNLVLLIIDLQHRSKCLLGRILKLMQVRKVTFLKFARCW